MELEGKVAIVTGAASGIGHAIAEAFGAAGAAVCVNWFGEHGAAAAELAGRLDRGLAYEADVSSAAAVAEMVAAVVERFGRLDVLVNNAAINHRAPLLELDPAAFDAVLAVNLRGALCCLQAAGRAMRDTGPGGSIINISSIHEDVAFPTFTPYAVSKGGLRMLMRNAALELAPFRIRVNNIAPGAIETPLNMATVNDPSQMEALRRLVPLERMGLPEEVAALAVFLASDRASYVTGATYTVDGGMSGYAEPV